MKNCFLRGYGNCSPKISREHYISATVLQTLSTNNTIQVSGLSWQTTGTLQNIGVQALQSKILCDAHNSGLSALDNIGGQLFRTLDAIDKEPLSLPVVSQLDGASIERWLVKMLCGLTVAGSFGNGIIPDQWKYILTGGDWPSLWGIYLPPFAGPRVFSRELSIETGVDPVTRRILMATFHIAGVPFNLILGKPDQPDSFGIYRPQGLIFQLPMGERCLDFCWSVPNDLAVVYTQVGRQSN